jgi:hypothetical protein
VSLIFDEALFRSASLSVISGSRAADAAIAGVAHAVALLISRLTVGRAQNMVSAMRVRCCRRLHCKISDNGRLGMSGRRERSVVLQGALRYNYCDDLGTAPDSSSGYESSKGSTPFGFTFCIRPGANPSR